MSFMLVQLVYAGTTNLTTIESSFYWLRKKEEIMGSGYTFNTHCCSLITLKAEKA
jgi:hypothetical protein